MSWQSRISTTGPESQEQMSKKRASKIRQRNQRQGCPCGLDFIQVNTKSVRKVRLSEDLTLWVLFLPIALAQPSLWGVATDATN